MNDLSMDYIANNTEAMLFNMTDANSTNVSVAFHTSSIDTASESKNEERSTFYHNDFTDISAIILKYVTTPVSVFGIMGNLLTLAVLTRRSLKITMMTMERSSHEGLTALSVSDLFYCITILPLVTMGNPKKNPYFPIYLEKNFDIIYRVYHAPVVNIFLTSSTWLTVMMAAQRYLAICHPIKARQLIDYKYTRLIITFIFFAALFLNIPRFWEYEIISAPCMTLKKEEYCAKGPLIYADIVGALRRHKSKDIYNMVYFILSILLPLTALTYCNVNLIVTLRKSTRLRRNSSSIGLRSDINGGTHRITLTLIIIIIMFTILVVPGEVSNFVWSALDNKSEARAIRQNFSASILSLLQRINFSFNFILYCAINTQFRRTLYRLFCCKCESTNSHTSSSTKRSFINLPTIVQHNRSSSLDHAFLTSSRKSSSSSGSNNITVKNDYRMALLKTKSSEQILEVKH